MCISLYLYMFSVFLDKYLGFLLTYIPTIPDHLAGFGLESRDMYGSGGTRSEAKRGSWYSLCGSCCGDVWACCVWSEC